MVQSWYAPDLKQWDISRYFRPNRKRQQSYSLQHDHRHRDGYSCLVVGNTDHELG